MNFRATEKLRECPFNPVHQILPHRMASHIAKCWKNHPDADVKRCVFNATHIIKTPLYESHILECPDRAIVERDLCYREKANDQLRQNEQPKKSSYSLPSTSCEEDWDNDIVISSYNPTEHIIYREFTRPPPPGLGKAARREWRKKEIERVQRLKDGKPIFDLISDEYETSEPPQYKPKDTPTSINHCRPVESDTPRRPRLAANIFNKISESEEHLTHKLNI
ncbi:hypothetical protein SK128_024934 [Halocaridina rubra]|uniref:CHHC U11-48K-type domain-containing protein n=1 Tax=Halocaridina rubra TaxID=373956 RepID=A0AAN8ZQG1_HALRR